MASKKQIEAELTALSEEAKKKGRLLQPRDVVDYARDPNTALHSKFDWEDTEAAEKWRLHQARNVINVYVTILPSNENAGPVRAMVSLKSDRHAGGGYRATVDVLSDADLRAQMIRDALDELRRVRGKYQTLKELRPVWQAIEKIEGRSGAKSVVKTGGKKAA